MFVPDINNFFRKALANFEKNPKLLALTVILKTLPEYETWADRISWAIVSGFHRFANNIVHQGSSSGEFQMFRAEAFRKVNGYNPAMVFGEDAEIFFRLSKIGQTRTDGKLYVMHTSRRAHNAGWFSLWSLWTANIISNLFRKKAVSKEWKVSR